MAENSAERSEWEARLGDVVDVLQGIGLELEAIKIILRVYVTAVVGRDPLAGTYLDEEPS
jgi:hypothetical protein